VAEATVDLVLGSSAALVFFWMAATPVSDQCTEQDRDVRTCTDMLSTLAPISLMAMVLSTVYSSFVKLHSQLVTSLIEGRSAFHS
jgi:hypothetical protein